MVMPQGGVETYREHGLWKNKIEGESSYVGSYYVRDEAIGQGRKLAADRKVEHIIRGIDGQIHERNSYGHPSDVKG
jgi:hypothetical protein